MDVYQKTGDTDFDELRINDSLYNKGTNCLESVPKVRAWAHKRAP